MSNPDLTKTQEMAIPEPLADVYRNDPLGVYSHRREAGCIVCGAPVSGDVYCDTCLTLEVAQAEEAPPVYIGEGMEDD